ncbi:hypothetical protein ACHJH3_08725 [Campylobacter sp. MOP7]|uniref:hypothetical protein n=1 Tax=Campylobacter canis TaxID=3378588 RepID=UPI00387EB90A
MSKSKCPLRELKEKQGGLLKYLNKLDNFVEDTFEKVEDGYDKFANWADENIPYAVKVLDVRKFGKEIDELLQAYTRTKSAIYAQATQFKEYFENLSVSDRKTLFKALDGEFLEGVEGQLLAARAKTSEANISQGDVSEGAISVTRGKGYLNTHGSQEAATKQSSLSSEDVAATLPEHLRGLYTKVRQAIDNGANTLVEAGVLYKDNVITHYIKHYYKKHLEEAKVLLTFCIIRFYVSKKGLNMPKIQAPLTDATLKLLKPREKIYRMSDGQNLFIAVQAKMVLHQSRFALAKKSFNT